MIRKLRWKFIWIAMVAMIFVLGTIVAAINVLNYQKTDKYSDGIISLLTDNEGGFPQDFPFRPSGDGMTPETPFEARFFSVMLDKQGEVAFSHTEQIAAITQETAEKYAKDLYANGEKSGMYDDYKYRVKETDEGTLYIFLDCTREMNSFRNFLQTSILISLGGLAVVFILIIIFSHIALKPVEESSQKQKSFITNASHDIKTPLTIINAGTEVIELEHGEGEWTKEIKKQTERLALLTDKLVFLSRMEEEQKTTLKEFNFSNMFTKTLQPYETLAGSKGLELIVRCQPEILYIGNEEMLRQAIALLLDNAIKYTTDKGTISATLKQTAKGIELKFRNDTENIKQGNLSELFERFYRMEKSRNSNMGGNGIGMSVVKAIVTAHKGKVSAFSPDGESIEITIIL